MEMDEKGKGMGRRSFGRDWEFEGSLKKVGVLKYVYSYVLILCRHA